MKDLDLNDPKRRRLMQASLVMGGLGALLSVRAAAAQRSAISMQLGWVPGGGQVGEVVAKRLGFMNGKASISRSSPAGPISMAWPSWPRAVGRPDRSRPAHRSCWRCPRDCRSCFAVGVQRHPYAFRWARTRSASLRT